MQTDGGSDYLPLVKLLILFNTHVPSTVKKQYILKSSCTFSTWNGLGLGNMEWRCSFNMEWWVQFQHGMAVQFQHGMACSFNMEQ